MQATPGFKAERHSLADIEGMIAVLEDAWDPQERKQIRRLTEEETQYIANERLVCTHDFLYYLNYVKINDYTKTLTRFVPNIAQRVILDAWAEMERARWAIMMLFVKARQEGVSLITEIAVAHRVQFWTDVDAVVASSTPGKTEKLARMIRTNWDHQPWWLMPRTTKTFNLMPAEFGELNSSLDCSQSGNQFSGVARGSTPSVAHMSELSEWDDPAKDIDASLLNAIHETPSVFLILESTANGQEDWWHRKYRSSKTGWLNGTARLCPMFLPWFIARDIYPDEGWLRKHPIPMDWEPDESIVLHAHRAAAYVHNNPRLKKILGPHWVLPREQMWWYAVERENARKEGTLNKFYSEIPADDHEAFQVTKHSVFPLEIVASYREHTTDPLGTYKLIGIGEQREDVHVDLRPTALEVDTSKPRIPIRCQWGVHDLRYELVPVLFQGYDLKTDEMILIWELPREGYEYIFGVDTGDGLGLDSSVCEGLRKGTVTENDRQILEVASPYINALAFWPWAYALASFYTTSVNGEKKQPRVVIDCQKSGLGLQEKMRNLGWWHFHRQRIQTQKRINATGISSKDGFYANEQTRTWMLNLGQTYLNNLWLDINSPLFVGEMGSFTKDINKTSARAAFGGHDDRLSALFMPLFSAYGAEVHLPRLSLAEQRAQAKSDPDPEYDVGWQGRDVTTEGASEDQLELLNRIYSSGRRK